MTRLGSRWRTDPVAGHPGPVRAQPGSARTRSPGVMRSLGHAAAPAHRPRCRARSTATIGTSRSVPGRR